MAQNHTRPALRVWHPGAVRRLVGYVILSLLCSSACGNGEAEPSALALQVEDGPAPPCSVNSMLIRDTSSSEFKTCAESSIPLSGEAAICVKDAVEQGEPFTMMLKTGRPTPVGIRPTLVGATYQGEYRLRMYMQSGPGRGERSAMELLCQIPSPSGQVFHDVIRQDSEVDSDLVHVESFRIKSVHGQPRSGTGMGTFTGRK